MKTFIIKEAVFEYCMTDYFQFISIKQTLNSPKVTEFQLMKMLEEKISSRKIVHVRKNGQNDFIKGRKHLLENFLSLLLYCTFHICLPPYLLLSVPHTNVPECIVKNCKWREFLLKVSGSLCRLQFFNDWTFNKMNTFHLVCIYADSKSTLHLKLQLRVNYFS